MLAIFYGYDQSFDNIVMCGLYNVCSTNDLCCMEMLTELPLAPLSLLNIFLRKSGITTLMYIVTSP